MAVPRRQLPTVIALATLLAGCGTTETGEHKSLIPLPWKHHPTAKNTAVPKLPPANSGRGGYYKDDGPGDNPPPGLMDLPDAVVKAEPYAKWANRPYSVFGTTYTPILHEDPFVQSGVASWYGVKFHGQKTSSGELYDMYKMTAAHPTLPIPSYARVTSVETGKSVVVRINDRGPFHASRIIDVSYTAALKLGLLGKGSHQVEIERLFPNDPTRIATVRRAITSEQQSAPPEIAALMLEDRVQTDSAAVAQVGPPVAKLVPRNGFYVQLGAYGRAGTAEAMGERLNAAGVEVGKLEVVKVGSVNRLFGGPFETREDASAAARAVPASFGLKPIVVKR
ncbi:septal ring lytic transglycosylase RlpA family protein [Massilia sp. G4R7]|uniref:Endolytic peptidoglycan transglycosylase RlpA n=1 Tax=Massilia phyllostachyos TaxID=2898585 RepID=A0ABS8Q983_9BURK|nr:septal ring lytic transglycosylase RlpA family protein [Massilia phyllostachyos]MCD2518312.1 septal ring lytic transglycosylase RlpA family protein [Massilia phyllostachyos]